MTGETFLFKASDGNDIAVHHWLPEADPSIVILISHGMAEFAARYDRFAEAANARGYAVFAPDHRGHGETAGSLSKLGYLADGDGFGRVMEDLHEIALDLKSRYPGKPLVLLGHSFGSFVSQFFIESYGDLLKGCVLSGTRGPDTVTVAFGLIFAKLVSFCCGRKKPSPFLTQLSFSANNKRIQNPESPNAWLSRDAAEVEKYDASPWAGFTCSAGFYRDLASGLSRIHRKGNIARIPRGLPVFLLCGSDDPVGAYGKTVRALADLYTSSGMSDVALKIYEGGRHEMLNETNRDEVTADILDWIAGCR